MTPSVEPARLHFKEGTPYSEAYGDVYHSEAGGPAQARFVFLQGNEVQRRWAGRERFVILETGFGLGLNFLATWQAWRGQPREAALRGGREASVFPAGPPDASRAVPRV